MPMCNTLNNFAGPAEESSFGYFLRKHYSKMKTFGWGWGWGGTGVVKKQCTYKPLHSFPHRCLKLEGTRAAARITDCVYLCLSAVKLN